MNLEILCRFLILTVIVTLSCSWKSTDTMKLHMKNLLLWTFIVVTFRLLYMTGNRPWMRTNQCEMTYMYRIMNFMVCICNFQD